MHIRIGFKILLCFGSITTDTSIEQIINAILNQQMISIVVVVHCVLSLPIKFENMYSFVYALCDLTKIYFSRYIDKNRQKRARGKVKKKCEIQKTKINTKIYNYTLNRQIKCSFG